MSPLLLVLMLSLQKSLSNFDCISLKSGIFWTDDDDEVSQGCTNSNYSTLVSCGWEGYSEGYPWWDHSDGGYIVTQNGSILCYARMTAYADGVYAHARCCDFRHLGDVECIGTNFGSNETNGAYVIKKGKCDTEYNFLTGCSGITDEGIFSGIKGVYPGTAQPGTISVCLSLFETNFF